ncbi:Kinesin-like protein KIF20A [Grifola frondosa]|uniref:Kinesin-like protein n=1 Tax=Grifola frondosa TaxID=5627 RepID=A0A1C7MQU2_GRIFR|nr:Kinesin-like protein KIF20A [Grifola frondosa]
MSSKPRAPATRASSRNKSVTPVPTTTRTTRAASSKATLSSSQSSEPALKKSTATRKPLLNRANSPDAKTPAAATKPVSGNPTFLNISSPRDVPEDADREPIKAYLRIRPQLGEAEPSSQPYLEPLSDTSVRMSDHSSSSSHSRMSSINPSSIFTFSHIFPPEVQQSDFFNKTTLPLVRDLLEGQNALLFAYGVTNSGKTYTIQGGSNEGSAGILPRTLDVIFNSIEGLHGDGRFRPVRLQGVELASESSERNSFHSTGASSSLPVLVDVLDDLSPSSASSAVDTDSTALKLDRNHEYTIWLSYAEVYNEKVYDLLASVDTSAISSPSSPTPHARSAIPRPTSAFLNLPLPSSKSHPLLLTRKALPVKPCPSSDIEGSSADGNAGKYVAGLRQLRVHSATEAKELLRLGQLHRRVFGTLANSQSSRSHALVTIKVLRVHRGERNDPTSIQTSRLTLVDLAGSERTKHTHTSGERLREAGNINKSLMVLGQCMETLRANQRAVARSLAGGVTAGSRMDTRDVKRGLAIVPFRHSKLTEVLMDYFVGEGRAVMIVNVNPYDTGFDENVHVMKFAALAREVCTNPTTTVARVVPVPSKSQAQARDSSVVPHRRKVTISTGGPGRKVSEAHLEVLEGEILRSAGTCVLMTLPVEDEEPNEGDDNGDNSDGPINPLVDALFDEIENLRIQLYESEMRCALIEADTREEVMLEMEERMQSMEKMFARRLTREVERHEAKMDAKIDMLQRSTFMGKGHAHRVGSDTGATGSDVVTEDSHEDEFESSATGRDADYESTTSEDESYCSSKGRGRGRASSPLAGKSKKQSNLQLSASDEISGNSEDIINISSDEDDSDVLSASVEDSKQPTSNTPKGRSSKIGMKAQTPLAKAKHMLSVAPSPIFEADVKAGRAKANFRGSKLAGLQQSMDELSLEDDPDDSTVIIPNRKARQEAVAHGGPGVEYVPGKGEVDMTKKRKR